MLFSRKNPVGWRQAFVNMLWPRGGLVRMARYFWHRLLRLKNHPHQVALGVAIGVFVSFSPLIGLHGPLSVLLALSLRGSLLAAFMAQGVGNPVTFPMIWLACWKFGCWITGSSAPNLDLSGFSLQWIQVHGAELLRFLVPFSVGGMILGLICASLAYFTVHRLMQMHFKPFAS